MDYPPVDLEAIARDLGAELRPALQALDALYAEVDQRIAHTTGHLALPCHRGCDMCCHESVFLTPLEFLGAWDYVQRELPNSARQNIVRRGLALYAQHRDLIEAFNGPPPPGEPDHLRIAQRLKFTCPLLGADGACSVYPRRELYARLFGCSFNDAGGIYGCHLVGAHLAGKQVTLLPARSTARRLSDLPLTELRQVYPFYIHALYSEHG